MPPCGFIRDGYTREGFIAAGDDFPSLSFKYRPPLMPERAAISQKLERTAALPGMDGRGALESEKLAAKEIAAKLVEWDLVDENGQLVEVSAANVEHLHPFLASRLCTIVIYWGQSDPLSPEEVAKREAKSAKNLQSV